MGPRLVGGGAVADVASPPVVLDTVHRCWEERRLHGAGVELDGAPSGLVCRIGSGVAASSSIERGSAIVVGGAKRIKNVRHGVYGFYFKIQSGQNKVGSSTRK